MANTEKYLFTVDADTTSAVQKLQQITKLMDKIDKLHGKGIDDYFTTSQKDMDKAMRSMRDMTQLLKEVESELTQASAKYRELADSANIPENASKAQIRGIEKYRSVMMNAANDAVAQQIRIRNAYDDTLRKFREMSTFQQSMSKNFKPTLTSNDIFNLPSGEENFAQARKMMEAMADEADDMSLKLANVQKQIRDINKLDRRNDSLSRRGQASSYLSHQQAASFRKDYSYTMKELPQLREENMVRMTKLGQERSELFKRVQEIQQNPNASQADIERKIGMQNQIQEMDKERESRMILNRAIMQSIENMRKYNARLEGVEEKPERGTTRGMIYERAPAIGLSAMGAFAAVFTKLYSEGAANSEAMRNNVISTGTWTGMNGKEWNKQVQNNAMKSGLKDNLGFNGQQMLAFQQSYLQNEGYNNMKDLNTAMQNQAVFSRSTGIDADTTSKFFSQVFSSGAVSGAQVKDIQDAFVGAIKNSGMEGREKDQLSALQGILQGVSAGRSLSNQEVMNTMGVQSILGRSNQRSLTGEQGGQLLSQLNSGIRSGINDSQMRLLFGQGTKYQGLSGRFELRKQMDKGISDPENIATLGRYAQALGGSNKEAQNEVFASLATQMGVNITGEQAQGMMDLFRKGDFSQEAINRVLREDKSKGDKTSEKNLKNYQNSDAADNNQNTAKTQMKATNIYDDAKLLRDLNSTLGNLPAPIYALAAAVGVLAASLIGAGFALRGSSVLRRLSGKKFTNPTVDALPAGASGKGPKGGGPKGGGGSGTDTGGGGGPILGADGKPLPPSEANKGFFGKAKTTVKGWFGRVGEGVSKLGGQNPGGMGFYGRLGSGLKNLGSKTWQGVRKLGGSRGESSGGSGVFGRIGNGMKNLGSKTWQGTRNIGGKVWKGINKLGGQGPGGHDGIISGGMIMGTAGATGAKEATGALGKAGRVLGGVGRFSKGVLTKGLLPLNILMGGIDIAQADKNDKGKTTGKVAGGILGGMAGGAAAGAAAGTIVPGAGNVVGGVVGGLVGLGGSILGSMWGSKLGEHVGSKFDPHSSKVSDAPKIKKGSENLKDQVDRENTTTKERVEKRRQTNVSQETYNLNYFDKLLTRARNLLSLARMQNGIIGSVDGAIGNSDGDAPSASGNSNASKIWNYFAQKGYSSKAIAGIMGNLQQESGLNPNAKQPNGPGRGLAQWSKGGRWDELVKWAKAKGLNPNSLDTQLQFMSKEMNSRGLTPEYMNGMSLSEATEAFEKKYEAAGKPNMSARNKYASSFYNQYGSSVQQVRSTGTSASKHNVKVDSTVHVNVNNGQSLTEAVNSSKELEKLGKAINAKIYGAIGYFSKEMKLS